MCVDSWMCRYILTHGMQICALICCVTLHVSLCACVKVCDALRSWGCQYDRRVEVECVTGCQKQVISQTHHETFPPLKV